MIQTITLFALMKGIVSSLPDEAISELYKHPYLGVETNLRMTKTLGQTVWDMDRVGIVLAAQVSPSQCQETVRHEIAHVCAGPRARHGPGWRRWAKICGATPVATCGEVGAITRDRWRVVCGGCSAENELLRSELRGAGCAACGVPLPVKTAKRSKWRRQYIVGVEPGTRYGIGDMVRAERFRRIVAANKARAS